MSSGDYASYRPEKYYLIKSTWTSTYSERDDGYGEELFYIRFYDACYVNELTISYANELPDVLYNIGAGSTTYTPTPTTTVATGTCPLTATCEIYSETNRVWHSCSDSAYNSFYSSFSTTTGALTISYTTAQFRSDYSAPYDEVSYLVRITLEDTRSEHDTLNVVTDTYQITFRDACSQDVLALTSQLSAT